MLHTESSRLNVVTPGALLGGRNDFIFFIFDTYSTTGESNVADVSLIHEKMAVSITLFRFLKLYALALVGVQVQV